jgi:hypothetical protein
MRVVLGLFLLAQILIGNSVFAGAKVPSCWSSSDSKIEDGEFLIQADLTKTSKKDLALLLTAVLNAKSFIRDAGVIRENKIEFTLKSSREDSDVVKARQDLFYANDHFGLSQKQVNEASDRLQQAESKFQSTLVQEVQAFEKVSGITLSCVTKRPVYDDGDASM